MSSTIVASGGKSQPQDPWPETPLVSTDYADQDCTPDIGEDEEVPGPTPKKESTTSQSRMWSRFDSIYRPVVSVEDELEPAMYIIGEDNNGLFFNKREVQNDNIIELPDNTSEKVLKEIRKFWSREDHFREYGFLWKRGVLLYGPQGSGKTSTINILSKEIISRGGIVINGSSPPSIIARGLGVFRQIEPNKPVVLLLEDIDTIIKEYGEPAILSLLDGESQVDNIVVVATTNYPELLEGRLTDRPSRFDLIAEVGDPTEAARRKYFVETNKRFNRHLNNGAGAATKEELEKWVQDTEGYSIAHLRELIILVEVFGMEYDYALERLKKMRDSNISSEDFKRTKLGFM